MSQFEVEIVFALPQRQLLKSVTATTGDTVADVIAKSGLSEDFADYDLEALSLGVWGHPAKRNRVVKEGDRIEIYRPLQLDPRKARRQLALSGRTMGSADSD